MNWLDILLIIIVGYSLVAGFSRGLARESVGFIAIIIGLGLALWFYGTAGSFLLPYVSSRNVASVLGFLLILAVVIVAGALAGRLLSRILKIVHLSWLDRFMGAGFGLVKGVLVSSVLVMLLMAFSTKSPPDSVARSRFAPYVVGASDVIVSAAPREVRMGFRRSYERVKRIWADTIQKSVRVPNTEEL